MRILEDNRKIFPVLRRHIKNFGHLPAHNLYFLLYYYTYPGAEPFYFDFGKRGGILGWQDKGILQIIGEPLGETANKLSILSKVLGYIYRKTTIRKILLEDCGFEFRKRIGQNVRSLWKVRRPSVLSWPVLDLEEFDENLTGRKWKRLRYVKNSFSGRQDVDIVEADKVGAKDLEELVHYWRRSRNLKERVYYHQYINAINGGFAGCDIKKAILIDGKPAAIIAGWKIPNTDGYYSFMDIHDYRHKNIGEFANLIVLQELKKKGVGYVDFGGGDKKSLIFKMKFQPNRFYKTYSFYISKLQ